MLDEDRRQPAALTSNPNQPQSNKEWRAENPEEPLEDAPVVEFVPEIPKDTVHKSKPQQKSQNIAAAHVDNDPRYVHSASQRSQMAEEVAEPEEDDEEQMDSQYEDDGLAEEDLDQYDLLDEPESTTIVNVMAPSASFMKK